MSPRSKEQVEEIRRESSQQIMDAALHLFAHNGFHNTSISQIAKEVGISKGLIYNYFASKDDLLQSIVEKALKSGNNVIQRYDPNEKDQRNHLGNTIDVLFRLVEKKPTYWKLIMALSLQDEIMSKISDQVQSHAQKNLGYLTSFFETLQVAQPEREAMFYAAVLDGIFLHYIYAVDQYPLEEMKAFLKQRIEQLLNHKSQ